MVKIILHGFLLSAVVFSVFLEFNLNLTKKNFSGIPTYTVLVSNSLHPDQAQHLNKGVENS